MNRSPSINQRLRLSREKKARPEISAEWPFFLILTFALAFTYVQSILSNSALREPVRLILFSLLMIVHISLHWSSVRLKDWNRVAIYVLVQSALAFTVVYLGASIGLLLAAYMGLIGETIGLVSEKPRWMILSVVVLLALSLLNYILLSGQGEWYFWLLAMLPMTFFVAVYVTLYSRQAEARRQAQMLLKDLESANRQLSEYAARVEDLTIANERQRMARELHDTLSQGLAGLILQLEAVDAHLAGDRPDRARAILENSMQKARATLADARRAIDDLRRTGEVQLDSALRQEVERFRAASGISCELELALPEELPPGMVETVLRTVSEGLANIARHAQASHASLRIVIPADENQLSIEIQDDGVGFDPTAIAAGHYGLLGMRERIRLAGGHLEIRSGAGRGTRLQIRLPLGEGGQTAVREDGSEPT